MNGCERKSRYKKKCFIWSILPSLHPLQYKNNSDGVSIYQEHEHVLNTSGIQYPVDIKDIGEFEHQNNISVNVYGCEDKNIFSLRITITNTGIHHENLLYITVGKTSHYVLVKDLGRLLLRQYNNDNSKRCFCQYCLHDCTSEVVLKNHFGRCKLHGAQSPKLPEADNKEGHENVKFTKTDYQLHLPFVICMNFESAARKQDSCEPSSSKSFTTQYQ